jgi:putative PIG3 family NAD(P)H quinone oxidoreductase
MTTILSNTMKAIEIGTQTLQLVDFPIPTPSAQQVLIEVAAAGVNRPDIMQRQGLYPPPVGASGILGLEIAGTIIAVGKGVSQSRIGDQVCALVTGGGYAAYCLASVDLCLPIPDGLTFVQAAAIPETFFTVWSNVFDRARLQPNETLLVHGGSSGIGTTAIQLAKAFDAKVFVTAGSDEKCQFCLELGADAAINYRTHDFHSVVQRLTRDNGVDVILDMVGGEYFQRNLKCLNFDGRLVEIALQHGLSSEINLLSVLLKRLTITGSTLRNRDDAFKADIAKKLYAHVWPLLANGTIVPIIHATFPLAEAAQAHALMESSQHIGKIILDVSEDSNDIQHAD